MRHFQHLALCALLCVALATGCSKKSTAEGDKKKKDNPKKVTTKNPAPESPTNKGPKTVKKVDKPKYSGPNADLKERLEKAYLDLRCTARKTKPGELATKQASIYKKYGFKTVMDYTDGLMKLQKDSEYWKTLLNRAREHCKI